MKWVDSCQDYELHTLLSNKALCLTSGAFPAMRLLPAPAACSSYLLTVCLFIRCATLSHTTTSVLNFCEFISAISFIAVSLTNTSTYLFRCYSLVLVPALVER